VEAGELEADRARKPAGRTRSSRPGPLTPEWRPLRGGSRCGRGKGRYERPAPLGSRTAKCRDALILGKRNRPWGSRTARLPELPNAMLSTVSCASTGEDITNFLLSRRAPALHWDHGRRVHSPGQYSILGLARRPNKKTTKPLCDRFTLNKLECFKQARTLIEYISMG
jgi:hypothetical protein